MAGLSRRAQAYLCLVALGGILAAGWAAMGARPDGQEAGLIAGLSAAAAMAQVFEVRTPNNKAYNATIAFLLTAAILVSPVGAVLVAAAPFVVEQVRQPKQLYIQCFNVASHIVCAVTAAATYDAVLQQPLRAVTDVGGTTRGAAAALAALAAFLLVNHVTLALVLLLARGVRLRDSGLFGPEGLITDATLLALGVVIAALWSAGGLLVLFALVPFTLLQRALYFPALRTASRTDPKTGLFNTAYFNEVAEEEIRRAARIGTPLSVLVADLDLLRNINNSYGHLAGDVVLKGVADILREEVREYDVASRFGGEEFAILLPAADAHEARQVAERIRGRVAREPFHVTTSVAPINATLSIGIATIGTHGADLKTLMHAADIAVYRAKLEGRDRVRVAHIGDDIDVAPDSLRPSSPVGLLLGQVEAITAPTPIEATPSPGTLQDLEQLLAVTDSEPAGHRAAPSMASRPTWPVTVLCVLAALVAAPLVLVAHPAVTAALIVFPLLALGAELYGENMYGSSFVSLSAVPILGAVASGRPAAALAAAAVSGLAASVAARARLEQYLFNTATYTFAAAVAVQIRLLLDTGSLLQPDDLPLLTAVMLVATLGYYLVDNGLVSLVVAQDEGRDPLKVFRADYAWLAPHFCVFGFFGTLLGTSWESYGGFGLAAFLVPALLVRVAQRQYLQRTEDNVAALRRLARDLTDSQATIQRSNIALGQALVGVKERHLATARALAGAIDARDKTTGGHIERVSALGRVICEVVDPILAADPQVSFGFLLHDVGKIGVPDSVLLKAGPLDAQERTVIERHPEIGEALLADAGFADIAREIVLTHHERWDGNGYPRGLKGTEIPLCSRIFAVADSLDAMTNDRPYRKGMDLDEAFAELQIHAGTQFDPHAVEALLSIPVDRVRELLRLGRNNDDAVAALERILG